MSNDLFSEFEFEPEFEKSLAPKKVKVSYRPPTGFLGMSLGQTTLITMMFFFTVIIIGTMLMVGLGKMDLF